MLTQALLTQAQANPQITSPVRLIENHHNGKGVLGQTKKTRAREKSKKPSPGLSPRDLHELTYSADGRCARQFSESSPRPNMQVAAAIVAVIVRDPVCHLLGPQLTLVPCARRPARPIQRSSDWVALAP